MRKLLRLLVCLTGLLTSPWLLSGWLISATGGTQIDGTLGKLELLSAKTIQAAIITPAEATHNLATHTLNLNYTLATTTETWLPTTDIFYFIGDLAIDPSNANNVYAMATNSSRIFKTTNGGVSWTEILLPVSSCCAPTVHPANPNIVYVGKHLSVVKSVDAGASWFELPPTGASAYVEALAVDPTNTTTVYAGVKLNWGVYKTTNGGASWSNVLSTVSVTCLEVDPTNPSIVYAGTHTYSPAVGGVFKSTDGGMNWTKVLTSITVTSLAIDPVNTSIIYAGTEDSGIFKSINGGVNWSNINTGLTHTAVRTLAVDPTNTKVVYAGTWGGGVFRSINGGASWDSINTGLTDTFIQSLVVAGDGNVVYTLIKNGDIFKWLGPPPPDPSSTYAHVVDKNGQPVVDVQIYRNGQLASGATNIAGNLILTGVQVGDTLVALSPVYTQSTIRQGHAGWAYRVH